jgi:hypothetical protein
MRWAIGIRFSAIKFFFSLVHGVHTSLRPNQTPTHKDTGEISPGEKRLDSEAFSSPPSSAEVKKRGNTPPFPHTSSKSSAQLICEGRTLPKK